MRCDMLTYESMLRWHGHVLALATQQCLCLDPQIHYYMALDGFSALLCVLSAPEVFAEIKR